jgi:hypothetical protein
VPFEDVEQPLDSPDRGAEIGRQRGLRRVGELRLAVGVLVRDQIGELERERWDVGAADALHEGGARRVEVLC